MSRYEEIEAQEAALAEAVAHGDVEFDLSLAGTVEAPPPPIEEPMVVCTLRVPPELYLRVKRAADERGLRPSTYMRELLETAMTPGDDDPMVTVRLSELHRAVDQIARRAA